MNSFLRSLRSFAAKISWRKLLRKRFVLPLVAVTTFFVSGILHPVKFIDLIARFFPFSMTVEKAVWTSSSSIHFEKINMGHFARIESMDMNWKWIDFILRGEIQSVILTSPQVWTEKLAEAFPKTVDEKQRSRLMRLGIQRIEINKGYLNLENIVPKVSLIIPLGREKPLILENFQLGNPGSRAAQEIQHLTSEDITLYSPLDPTSPVLHFESIEMDFTLNGIAHNTIQKLLLKWPTIYVGPDLFWFVDQFQANQKETKTIPWQIDLLEINSTRITINGFGDPGLTLPLRLSKTLKNVRTDNLGEVLKYNEFAVDEGDYYYPSYGLRVYHYNGVVKFGLPLEEANATNQVIILRADAMEWKKLQITDPWISLTFDSRGVFGKIGGKAYNGYLAGECSIFFKPGFPWNASLHGTGLKVEEPISKLVEDHFQMTGIMNIDLRVNAKSTVFEKSTGKIWLTGGGKMTIPAIDDVVQKLPPSWSSLKRQLTTIGLEAFKTFDYTSGTFDITYDQPKSQVILDLQGKQGRRRFQVDWTQE